MVCRRKNLLVAGLLAAVSLINCAAPQKDPVRIYETPGSEAQHLANLVVSFMLDSGFQIPTEIVSGPADEAQKSLADGKVDLVLFMPAGAGANNAVEMGQLIENDSGVKTVSTKYKEEHPEAADFLQKITLKKQRVEDTLVWHQANGSNWDHTMVRFFLVNKSQWRVWVSEGLRAAINGRMNEQKSKFEAQGAKF